MFMREIQNWAKHEKTAELRDILRQSFIHYDGLGPVPSQIHSYLSTNFKELRNLAKDDPVLIAKARDRWYVPDPGKQIDLEKLRERTLLAEFETYKHEVGLGKTIEAGLIIRELKVRGLVRRLLVVAPAGLVLQWQSEMKTHFNEDFRLVLPGSFTALRQAGAVDADANIWRMHDQVVWALKGERKEVELLLSAARRCEASGPDVKAEALLDRIQSLQRDESDPSLKILIFTEFVPTQTMLAEYLEPRGLSVVCLNGSMDLDQRQQVQRRFAGDAQILISTDAGGEGLNLQFCHVVVNLDLPWNPMKLEQRIGRVDRIGQRHIVRALNFALDGTVELRVREVLEEKLLRILEEFGVDKLADVLDSEEGGVPFEELFAQAIVAPEEAERKAMELADEIRRSAEEARAGSTFLAATERLDPTDAQKIANHQIPSRHVSRGSEPGSDRPGRCAGGSRASGYGDGRFVAARR